MSSDITLHGADRGSHRAGGTTLTLAAVFPSTQEFREKPDADCQRMTNSLRWHACALENDAARRGEIFQHVDEFIEEAISNSVIRGRELIE